MRFLTASPRAPTALQGTAPPSQAPAHAARTGGRHPPTPLPLVKHSSLLWAFLFLGLALAMSTFLAGAITASSSLMAAGAAGVFLAAVAGLVVALARPFPQRRHALQGPAAGSEFNESAFLPEVSDGLEADECMQYAREAMETRRWARALRWTQRAKALTPPNARILGDEGECLFHLGLFEEALDAFRACSLLDPEGHIDYRGAQAATAAGRPIDEVLAWLERALEKSPDLVGDLDLFRDFDTLRGMPACEALVARTYARLKIDPSNPGGPA